MPIYKGADHAEKYRYGEKKLRSQAAETLPIKANGAQ